MHSTGVLLGEDESQHTHLLLPWTHREGESGGNLLWEGTVGDLHINEAPSGQPSRQASPVISVSLHHQFGVWLAAYLDQLSFDLIVAVADRQVPDDHFGSFHFLLALRSDYYEGFFVERVDGVISHDDTL